MHLTFPILAKVRFPATIVEKTNRMVLIILPQSFVVRAIRPLVNAKATDDPCDVITFKTGAIRPGHFSLSILFSFEPSAFKPAILFDINPFAVEHVVVPVSVVLVFALAVNFFYHAFPVYGVVLPGAGEDRAVGPLHGALAVA